MRAFERVREYSRVFERVRKCVREIESEKERERERRRERERDCGCMIEYTATFRIAFLPMYNATKNVVQHFLNFTISKV